MIYVIYDFNEETNYVEYTRIMISGNTVDIDNKYFLGTHADKILYTEAYIKRYVDQFADNSIDEFSREE